jgi:hypothetical protein
MVRPNRNQEDNRSRLASEDDLGQLIRWSMKDSISEIEPAADVWPQILKRVREMPAPARPRRWSTKIPFPVAPFVQAVVVSALLLAFGLGVDQNTIMPREEHRIQATPTIHRSSTTEALDDVLSGYKLAQNLRELPTRRGGNIR